MPRDRDSLDRNWRRVDHDSGSSGLPDEFDRLLDVLHERGYDTITHDEGHGARASGAVPLPSDRRRERPRGWRRFLPRLYDASDPDLVPGEVRDVVDAHGWQVQPVGRDATTVTVLVEPGVGAEDGRSGREPDNGENG